MDNYTTYDPESEDLERMVYGKVRAERINDICARPTTERYNDYLALVRDQCAGEDVMDFKDEYRERAKFLVPRALDAFEQRHGVTVKRHRLYSHPDPSIAIVCAPDGIESGLMGMTVHCRQDLKTYYAAIEKDIDVQMYRHAQAMMLITGAKHWIHMDYFEDPELKTRKLHERVARFNKSFAEELEEIMIGFLLKTRLRARECEAAERKPSNGL